MRLLIHPFTPVTPPSGFAKTGPPKTGHRSGKCLDRRELLPLEAVDRIALNERCPMLSGVLDGRLQECLREALPAMVLGDEETDDRPDRLIVHSLEHIRPLEG